jgi:hypothetical protein
MLRKFAARSRSSSALDVSGLDDFSTDRVSCGSKVQAARQTTDIIMDTIARMT